MEGEILKGAIGTLGKYDLEFKAGQLVLEVDGAAALGSAGLVIKIDGAAIIDAVAKAIPGQIDDAVLGVIKAALLGK